MADPVAGTVPTPDVSAKPPQDEIKNLKEEMNRKFGNLEKSNQALINSLQAITAKKPTPIAEDPDAEDPYQKVWYDKPGVAAKQIRSEATQDTLAIIRQEQAEQNKKNQMIQGLYREYPELTDFNNPLSMKSVEFFDKLTDEEKNSPLSYKLAVKEAAEELGVMPKSKRKVEDDGDAFALTGKGSATPATTRSRRGSGVPDATIEFARHMGMDVDDEKVVERLKKRNERKNWMTWE